MVFWTCLTSIEYSVRNLLWQRISYYDRIRLADARHCEQPPPRTAVVGFRNQAGVAKDRPAAPKIEADCALISLEDMPIMPVETHHYRGEIARWEVGGLAVKRPALIEDF